MYELLGAVAAVVGDHGLVHTANQICFAKNGLKNGSFLAWIQIQTEIYCWTNPRKHYR
jgi:hypothetical protein